MITIQGKQFRNFAEQVKENKENIDKIKDIQPIINVSGDTVQPYLMTLTFRFYNRSTGEVASSGIPYEGYAIIYMTETEANQRIANKSFPDKIQLTRPLSLEEEIGLPADYIRSHTAIYTADISGKLYNPTEGKYPFRLIPTSVEYKALPISIDNYCITV